MIYPVSQNQCNITGEFNKLPISPEDNKSDVADKIYLLFGPKVLNAMNKIHERKKRLKTELILEYMKIEVSNVDLYRCYHFRQVN